MTFPKTSLKKTHTCRPSAHPSFLCSVTPPSVPPVLANGPMPRKATILPRCCCDECDESCRLVAVLQKQESGPMLNQKNRMTVTDHWDDGEKETKNTASHPCHNLTSSFISSHVFTVCFPHVLSCVVSNLMFSHFLTFNFISSVFVWSHLSISSHFLSSRVL